MKFALTLFSLMLPLTVLAQSYPGNVSANLRWWLKSNVGTYNTGTTAATNGQTVQTWDDQSTIGNDAANGTAANRPILRTNVVNGYSVLEFDGNKFLDAGSGPGIGATGSFHTFLVFKQNSYQTVGAINDALGSFIIDRTTVTDNLASFKVVSTNKYGYQRRQDDNSNLGGPISATSVNTTSFVMVDYFRNRVSGVSSTEGIYVNGALDISQAGPTGNMNPPTVRIGRHVSELNGGLNGYFAEVITYNTNLSTADRNKVESYLAVKYGITLTATTDYVRSDGTVIYPSTGTHSSYVTDIAGLGQDNSSGLSQTGGASQNPGNMITISGAAGMGNNEFLIWGHNNGSLTTPNTSDVGGSIVRRLSRVWRVAETGDVGSFSVTVDLSAVPGAKTSTDLKLLVDTNGTFATGAAVYNVNSSSGSTYTFTGVTITDDDFFTIGSTNAVTTPLPVELAAFDVSYEEPQALAVWKTSTETNNDFFTLEKSGEDFEFTEVALVKGAGTSNTPMTYSAIDPFPYHGKSYYRLKQTDFDGTFKYSDTKFLFIKEGKEPIAIFPNPSDGKTLQIRTETQSVIGNVDIIDLRGAVVESHIAEAGQRSIHTLRMKDKLPAGLYLLRLRHNGKETHLRFLVL